MEASGDAADSQDVPAKRKLPLVAEVIDNMGFGYAQVKAGIVGGGINIADGAELLLISSVSRAVADEWDLEAFARGAIVSLVFVGMFVGNIISGPIGDNFGRRRILVASLFGIFVFSLLSSVSDTLAELCIFRWIVGVCIGVGQPVWYTLGSEVTPTFWRVAVTAVSMSWFALGEMYAASLVLWDDPSMKTLHWRLLLRLGSIPAGLLAIVAACILQESPTYLALSGRRDEAVVVLEAMRADNRAEHVYVDFRLPPSKKDKDAPWFQVLREQAGVVFGQKLLLSTLVIMYCCGTLNLFYYGTMYAIPQLLPGISGSSAGAELVIGALWEIPGNALGIAFGLWMTRKKSMKVFLYCSVVCLLAFPMGNSLPNAVIAPFLTYGGYYGIKCFSNFGFVIVYQYTVELYPAEVRITGSALSLGVGRLASTAAPIIYELLTTYTNDYRYFFILIAACCVVNIVLIDLLKYETMGMVLQDHLDDSCEEQESGSCGSPGTKIPRKQLMEQENYGAVLEAPKSS